MKCGGSAWCWSNIKVPKKRDNNCGLAGGWWWLWLDCLPLLLMLQGRRQHGRGGVHPMYNICTSQDDKKQRKNNHIPPPFSDQASFFSFVSRWICKTIQLWAIMWTENDTLLWHVFPLPRSFSDVLFDAFVMYLWCVIWCTSNVYFPIPWWGHLAIPEGDPGRQGRGRGFDVSQNLEKANRMRI